MKVNEIRKTETIEKLVRIEYIAEDGTVFSNEEECKKYEESALFAISKELKRLDNKKNGASEYDIYDECSDEYLVEIFNAETERDIENIRRYISKLFQIVHMRERKMLIYLISQQGMK